MPAPCTVCAHPKRNEIDGRLAVQVVNVKQLALSYGLKRDAVARHRAKHLPAFLPALQSHAAALTLDQLNAEAQRLYLVALDALARAEAGTLSHVAEDGTQVYAISSTAVARLLREARSALDLLAKLAVAAPSRPGGSTPDQPALPEADDDLDQRIAHALDRALSRADPHVEDAVIVADESALPVPAALPAHDAARGAVLQAPPDLVRPTAGPPRATEVPLDAVAAVRVEAARRHDHISAAASREEIIAAGWQLDESESQHPA